MSDAAARQSSAASTSSVEPGAGELISTQGGPQAPQVSDLAVAMLAAQAVRAAPGVVDLSPGSVTPAVTYGAGRRVVGIVVHRATANAFVLEIHVILSDGYCAASMNTRTAAGVSSPDQLSILAHMVDQIRVVVYDALQDVAMLRLARVDVAIDDLC